MNNIIQLPIKNRKPKLEIRYWYSWHGYCYLHKMMLPEHNTHMNADSEEDFKNKIKERLPAYDIEFIPYNPVNLQSFRE